MIGDVPAVTYIIPFVVLAILFMFAIDNDILNGLMVVVWMIAATASTCWVVGEWLRERKKAVG